LLLIKKKKIKNFPFKKSRPTIITPGITNWNKFKDVISNKIILNIKLKSITDINQAIAKVFDDIQKVAKNSSIQSLFLNAQIYQQN